MINKLKKNDNGYEYYYSHYLHRNMLRKKCFKCNVDIFMFQRKEFEIHFNQCKGKLEKNIM